MPPEARLRVAGADVHLLGTIAGFVPDGERVRGAFAADRPEGVALGVPPEDVEGLRHLADEPSVEIPELDPQTQRLFEHLARFGATRVPSPDLEAAFALARDAGVPVEALDMDDETHSHVYIRKVGFFQAVRSGRVLRRILVADFARHDDPYALATAWDAYQNQQAALQQVEAAREEHMARRLREVAAGKARLLAVLPVARLAGVVRRLEADPTGAAGTDSTAGTGT